MASFLQNLFSKKDQNDSAASNEDCHECRECMQILQLIIDGEATEEQQHHFTSCIENCLHCLEQYEVDKSLKEVIQSKVERKCCPDSLINSIKVKIKEGAG